MPGSACHPPPPSYLHTTKCGWMLTCLLGVNLHCVCTRRYCHTQLESGWSMQWNTCDEGSDRDVWQALEGRRGGEVLLCWSGEEAHYSGERTQERKCRNCVGSSRNRGNSACQVGERMTFGRRWGKSKKPEQWCLKENGRQKCDHRQELSHEKPSKPGQG